MSEFAEVTSQDIEYYLTNLKQLVFEVTDSCNLRCKYCGYADLYDGYDRRENLRFPFGRAKLIIDYLYALWKEKSSPQAAFPVTIGFYGGEPLLNIPFIRQVIDYLEHLAPVGKKFFYNMTTNALLLDKYMDLLVEKEVRLLISLDGDREGQSYRVDAAGNNSFDRVVANIELLRNTHPEYFERFVMFNSVLHNRNSVESIHRFIKDTFGKDPGIAQLNNSGIRKDKIEEFRRTFRNIHESIDQASDCESLKSELFIREPATGQLADYIHFYTGNVFNNYNELLLQNGSLAATPTGTCRPFSKKMFVTVKGRILPCERINHEFALGRVTDTEVLLDYEQAAAQHNQYVFKYIRQCQSCAGKRNCIQCVYQIDDIHQENSRCYGYRTLQQQQEYKQNCLECLDRHPEYYRRILREVSIKG